MTFKEIVDIYRKYVKSNYGKATIVFDGYGNNPSTKDHEHLRRSMKTTNCPEVVIQPHIKVSTNQSAFLSNDANKMSLIDMISEKLEHDGCTVLRSTDDADTLIVKVALDHCNNGDSVTVFANDTDVIIMLMYFWKQGMGQAVIRSSFTKNGRNHPKQMIVEKAIQKLDPSIIPYLLFIHAFGGCDTVSALHEKGKAFPLRLLKESENTTLFDFFICPQSTQYEIGKAGVELVIMLYKGQEADTLTDLRYAMHMKMAATATKITPSKLPPTERSAWYHSLRAYLQICQWKSLMNCDLNPLEWGWKLVNEKMTPIMTDKVNILFCLKPCVL